MYLISKKLDYALRALTYLTTIPEHHACLARDIATARKIPMRFLQKIMKDLVDGRLVRSFQGPGGGYMLARTPVEITLKDVMESVEGPIGFLECVERDPDCGLYPDCSQIPVWKDLHQELLTVLAAKTLKELSGNNLLHIKKEKMV